MNSETLSLILRAQDETGDAITKMTRSVADLTRQVDTGSHSARGFGDVLRGMAMGVGIAVFNTLENALSRVANVIPDLISRGLAFSDLVDQLGDATGASAEETSRLIGTYQLLGISTDGLGTRMGKLASAVVDNEAKVNAYGIATRDASGHILNQVQIVENARRTLSQYADGTTKARVMTTLFGKAGLDMADYLSLSDRQVKVITDDLTSMGVVMSSSAAAEAEKAKQEMRRFDLSLQGVANTVAAAVMPALISAVDGLANWVRDNARQIANFAATAVNFVLGIISAITGASFEAVTFTDKLGEVGQHADAAGNSLDGMGAKTTKAAGASKAATEALDRQVAALDRQLTKLKAVETAEDAKFIKDMGRLTAKLGAELSAMDVAEKAHAIDEQRASLAQQMAAAQKDLATAQTPNTEGVVDPNAVQAAQDRIAAIIQAAADFETQIVNDARRAQITAVQAFVEAEMKSEQDATNKKKFVEREKHEAASLSSQIAAAQQRGDTQAVHDLTIELQAVQTAIARAEQAKRNTDREDDLTKHKLQLDELKKKMAATFSGGPGSLPDVVDKGTTAAGTMIGAFQAGADRDMGLIALAAAGSKPTSIAGAFESARLAGEKFGEDMKKVLGGVVDVVGKISGGVLDVANAIGGLHLDGGQITMIGLGLAGLAVATANIPLAFAAMSVIAMGSAIGAGDQKLPGIGALSPASTPDVGYGPNRDSHGVWIGPGAGPLPPGHASGGWVGLRGPEIGRLGEKGPEYIVPNGGSAPAGLGGGININVTVQGSAIFDPYGQAAQQIAQSLLPGLRRELSRQGMTLS